MVSAEALHLGVSAVTFMLTYAKIYINESSFLNTSF